MGIAVLVVIFIVVGLMAASNNDTRRHEARHAVAAHATGGRAGYIISHTHEDSYHGTVGGITSSSANGAHNDAVMRAAGSPNGFDSSDGHDYEQVEAYAANSGYTVEQIREEAEALLDQPHNRRAVNALVDALASNGDQLSGEEVNRIIAQAYRGEGDEESTETEGGGGLLWIGAIALIFAGLWAFSNSQPSGPQQRAERPQPATWSSYASPGDRSIRDGRSDCYEVSPGQVHCPR